MIDFGIRQGRLSPVIRPSDQHQAGARRIVPFEVLSTLHYQLASKSRIDRLTFECQDTKDAFMDAAQRLVRHEPLKRLKPQRKLS